MRFVITLFICLNVEAQLLSTPPPPTDNINPSADFYVKRTDVSVGDKVSFFSMAMDPDGSIDSYEWSVDGVTFSNKKVEHYTFNVAGNYIVRHRVVDNRGGEGVSQKVIHVSDVSEPLQVDLAIEWAQLLVGQPVRFVADVKPKGNPHDVRYFWKFGEFGEFIEGGSEKTFAFPSAGVNRMWLRVTNGKKNGETIVERSLFVDDPNKPPKVKVRAYGRDFWKDTETYFKLELVGLNEAVSEIEWDFGDGSTTVSNDVNERLGHVYGTHGEFTVTAIITTEIGKQFSASEKIVVNEQVRSLITPPNQVIIDERPYIELIPTQTYDLLLRAANLDGTFHSPGTITWSSSNSNVSIFSTFGAFATIKGISAGTAMVKVTVEGVESQPITVVVQPFTSNFAVAKYGEYFDSTYSTVLVGINRTTANYQFNNEYNLAIWQTDQHFNSDYVSVPQTFDFPTSKTAMDFSIIKYDQSESLSATKSGLVRFAGKGDYLFVPENSSGSRLIEFNDTRFVNLDQDFSVTLWMSREKYYGYHPELAFFGGYSTSLRDWSLSVQSSGSTVKVNFPIKEESGSWTHFGITYVQASRTMKAYVDGVLIGTLVVPNSPRSDTPTMSFSKFSNMSSTGSSAFDELRFWNRELSVTEIKNEMFNSVALPSNDLLASFSFDFGTPYGHGDDNGGSWKVKMNAGQVPGAGDFTVMREKDSEIDVLLNKTIDNLISAPMDSGNVKLSIPANTFATDEQLELSVLRCIGPCGQSSSYLGSNRLSSVVDISPMPIPSGSVEIKIPFDSQAISSSSKVKIGFSTLDNTGTLVNLLLEPNYVNMEEGYVSYQMNEGGKYWAMYNNTNLKATYSNADLKPSIFAYSGQRTLYTDIPSANTSYNLGVSSNPTTLNRVICNSNTICSNGGMTSCSFPISLTGLTATTNYCQLRFHSSTYDLDHYDLIIIRKN